MAKPRRKSNRRKTVLKSLSKKALDQETDESTKPQSREAILRSKIKFQTERLQDAQREHKLLKERKSQLEALRDKQQKRRRRLLWGEYDGDEDLDVDDGSEDDEHNQRNISEYDSDYYVHEGDDEDDDCGRCCPNPDCRNYSITTLDEFRLPQNPILIRPYWPSFGPLHRWMFEGTTLHDSQGVEYGQVLEYPINAKWMLLSMDKPEELQRIARDGLIEGGPHARYYAYVLPVGGRGFHYRDCRSDFAFKRMAMFSLPSLETELPLKDALGKIPQQTIIDDDIYKRLERLIS